jgi:hypothetical protein
MQPRWKKWWSWAKALMAVAILVFIGRQFYYDLSAESGRQLWVRPFHFGWLVLAGALYLLGLGLCVGFWFRLLTRMRQQPAFVAAVRAYYIGLLGKYVPGKAWALFLRAALIRSPQVRMGTALSTSFYEVLTTMAGGALLAALLSALLHHDFAASADWGALRELVALQKSPRSLGPKAPVVTALVLAAIVGIPVLPPIYNRLVQRIALRLPIGQARAPAKFGWLALGEGLVVTSGSWFFFGLSLWAVLRAVAGPLQPLTLATWGLDTAGIALAYVAGFIIVLIPSGLGVRELFLRYFLLQEVCRPAELPESDARATVALTVLLLRLVWTSAELAMVGLVYWIPGARSQSNGLSISPPVGRG